MIGGIRLMRTPVLIEVIALLQTDNVTTSIFVTPRDKLVILHRMYEACVTCQESIP